MCGQLRFLVVLALMLLAPAMLASFALAKGPSSVCEHTINKPAYCEDTPEEPRAWPKKIESS